MNVGLLIGKFPPDFIGGAELQVAQLAAELAHRGHTVTVFTRRYADRPYRQWQDGYLIRRRNELPVPVLRMVWDNFPALWSILRCRPRIRVLLCYQTLNSGLVGVLAQKTLGIPAIVSIRGNKEYRLHLSMAHRLLVPIIYRWAQGLAVQSPRMLQDLETQLEMVGQYALSVQVRNKTKVIPNGIRVPPGTRSDGDKIVYVGRLIPDKGVADLVKAMEKLPRSEGLIVGDGPERDRLEAMAREISVRFVGQVVPSEVSAYLQQARVLVLPSYQGDGFPNVVLEAMAYGVPVVATRTAGIPDLVQDGITGFLFEPGDIMALTSYIDKLSRDDDLWFRFSVSSLEAVRPYSWDVVAPQVEDLLASFTH